MEWWDDYFVLDGLRHRVFVVLGNHRSRQLGRRSRMKAFNLRSFAIMALWASLRDTSSTWRERNRFSWDRNGKPTSDGGIRQWAGSWRGNLTSSWIYIWRFVIPRYGMGRFPNQFHGVDHLRFLGIAMGRGIRRRILVFGLIHGNSCQSGHTHDSSVFWGIWNWNVMVMEMALFSFDIMEWRLCCL